MTLPNLVIAGATKCGTSSLFSWLVDHPDVCGSKPKEPFFLMDADNPMRRQGCSLHGHGLDAYARFFSHCAGEKIAVEATTHYIYQSTALEALATLPTEPRVLFLLRKPSERVYSSFAYSKARGNVRADLAFAEFVHLIRRRQDSGQSPGWASGASAYVLPRDLQYSRYVDYLSLWRDRLGDERIRVLLFEELRSDAKGTLQALCRWLAIDPSFYADYDFATRNRTVPVRSRKLQKMARAVAAKVPDGIVKDWLKRIFYSVQTKGQSEPPSAADQAALAELDEEFRPYDERLEREFGLNLDAWRQAAPARPGDNH